MTFLFALSVRYFFSLFFNIDFLLFIHDRLDYDTVLLQLRVPFPLFSFILAFFLFFDSFTFLHYFFLFFIFSLLNAIVHFSSYLLPLSLSLSLYHSISIVLLTLYGNLVSSRRHVTAKFVILIIWHLFLFL